MPPTATASKKRKVDGNAITAPAANDLFIIECFRKTEMDEYDQQCFIDCGEVTEEMIKAEAQKTDGKWFYTKGGKVVVFKSLTKANQYAAEMWDEILLDRCYARPVPHAKTYSNSASESESQSEDGETTTNGEDGRLKGGKRFYSESEDGLGCYKHHRDYYFGMDDYDEFEYKNAGFITTKVEVKRARLVN